MSKDEKEQVRLEGMVKRWRRKQRLANTSLRKWEGRLKRWEVKRQMTKICLSGTVEKRGRKFKFDD